MDNRRKAITFFLLVSLTWLLPIFATFGNFYPLTIEADDEALKKFMLVFKSYLTVDAGIETINKQQGTVSVRLILSMNGVAWHDARHILHTLNYMFNDSAKSFFIKLVDGDPSILIGDVRRSTIDIGDILTFGISAPLDKNVLTSEKILLHELYEQYYLQGVRKVNPAVASRKLINEAHNLASQQESNLFNFFMVKTDDAIHANYIHVEFTHRVNLEEKIEFVIKFVRGNVKSVEKIIDRHEWHVITGTSQKI